MAMSQSDFASAHDYHRPANDDGDGSSRCHSNTLDSWRDDNKRAGSSIVTVCRRLERAARIGR